MSATAWEVVIAIELVAILAGLTWLGYILFIKHDHADGPCGYCGCQAPMERKNR